MGLGMKLVPLNAWGIVTGDSFGYSELSPENLVNNTDHKCKITGIGHDDYVFGKDDIAEGHLIANTSRWVKYFLRFKDGKTAIVTLMAMEGGSSGAKIDNNLRNFEWWFGEVLNGTKQETENSQTIGTEEQKNITCGVQEEKATSCYAQEEKATSCYAQEEITTSRGAQEKRNISQDVNLNLKELLKENRTTDGEKEDKTSVLSKLSEIKTSTIGMLNSSEEEQKKLELVEKLRKKDSETNDLKDQKNTTSELPQEEKVSISKKTLILLACCLGAIILGVVLMISFFTGDSSGGNNSSGGNTKQTSSWFDFGGSTTEASIDVVTVTSIKVKTLPDKTEYTVGDTLDTTGLVLNVTLSDGSEEEVSYGFYVEEQKFQDVGEKSIEVDFDGIKTSFTVTVKKASSVKVGDVITFGKLSWIVLDVQGEECLIITQEIVDFLPYNEVLCDITWEKCSLRKYLNSEFLSTYIPKSSDQSRIIEKTLANDPNPRYGTSGGASTKDRVFLLSKKEVDYYFPTESKRVATYNGVAKYWWLRSPGHYTTGAAYVHDDGYSDGSAYYCNVTEGVRPAMWIEVY